MISLACPTRKRPESMKRLVDSAMSTASGAVEVCFYIDNDDSESAKVAKELNQPFVFGDRVDLTTAWNKAQELSSGDVFGYWGDDVVFKTKSWDILVREEIDKYRDKLVFVYGSDGYQPDTWGTHGFVHQKWVETLGFFLPPYIPCYADVWLNLVCNEIGRYKHIPILTEHLHFVNNKSEYDETYRDKDERHPGYVDNPELRERDIKKLLSAIEAKS